MKFHKLPSEAAIKLINSNLPKEWKNSLTNKTVFKIKLKIFLTETFYTINYFFSDENVDCIKIKYYLHIYVLTQVKPYILCNYELNFIFKTK